MPIIKELIKTAKFVLDCGSSGSLIPGITPKSTSGNCSLSLSEKVNYKPIDYGKTHGKNKRNELAEILI